MSAGAYKDFDAFFSEQKKQASATIRLFDEEYELPDSIPAIILLETYRLYKAGAEEIPEAKQLEIAMKLLGEDNVTAWCEKGLTMAQLSDIVEWAMGEITGQNQKLPAVKGQKLSKKKK